jgi:hypothetical protein
MSHGYNRAIETRADSFTRRSMHGSSTRLTRGAKGLALRRLLTVEFMVELGLAGSNLDRPLYGLRIVSAITSRKRGRQVDRDRS